MSAAVSPEEVAAVLRKVVAGEIAITLADPSSTWAEVYAGDVEFFAGGWSITFFNDCMELDYVDSATAPDGRRSEFDEWSNEETGYNNPLVHLTRAERTTLEQLLDPDA